MYFKGTIAITDPCYIIKKNHVECPNEKYFGLPASHDWCVTTIPDFDGEVNYYVNKQDNAHIVGIGNINFFTTQTSL